MRYPCRCSVVQLASHLESNFWLGPINWLDDGRRRNHAGIDFEPVHILDHALWRHHFFKKGKQMGRQFVMTAVGGYGVRKALLQHVSYQKVDMEIDNRRGMH